MPLRPLLTSLLSLVLPPLRRPLLSVVSTLLVFPPSCWSLLYLGDGRRLVVRSRFRYFAGNPRGRRSHGYCRIRAGRGNYPVARAPRVPSSCLRFAAPRRSARCAPHDRKCQYPLSRALRPRCALSPPSYLLTPTDLHSLVYALSM